MRFRPGTKVFSNWVLALTLSLISILSVNALPPKEVKVLIGKIVCSTEAIVAIFLADCNSII